MSNNSPTERHTPKSLANSLPPPADGALPLVWFAAISCVLVFFPGMFSAHFLPKTFWVASVLGLGFLVARPRRPAQFALTPLGLIWSLYLLWALLSLLWAPAWWPGMVRWWALLLPTAAYLFARRSRFWESERFWLLFLVLVSVVALIGLIQYVTPLIPWIRKIPLLGQLESLPGNNSPVTTEGQRNYASMFFALVLPFVVWRFYHARPGRDWRSWGEMTLAGAAMVLAAAFVLAARSRSAWLGLAFAVGFFVLAGGPRVVWRCRIRTIVAFLCIVCAAATVQLMHPGFLLGTQSGAKNDLVSTLANLFKSSDRTIIWQDCLRAANPWVGAGFGNFPIRMTPYDGSGQVRTLNSEVHNDYLQAYLDLGIPGVALFVLAFAWLVWLGWRGRRGGGVMLAAGMAAVVLAVMQLTIFTSEVISTQIWFAGVVAICNSQPGVRRLWRRTVFVSTAACFQYGLAALLFLFAFAVGRTMAADREFRRIDKDLQALAQNPKERQPARQQRVVQALHRAALEIVPTVWYDANMLHCTVHQFAPIAYDAGDFDAARAFAETAVRLHPTDASSMAIVGQLEAKAGHRTEAIAMLRKARAIALRDPDARVSVRLAEVLCQEQRFAEAFSVIEDALREACTLDCPYSAGFVNLLELLDQTGQKDRAAVLRAVAEKKRTGTPVPISPANHAVVDVTLQDAVFEWAPAANTDEYQVNFLVVYTDGRLGHSFETAVVKKTRFTGPEMLQLVNVRRWYPDGRLEPGTIYKWSVSALGRWGAISQTNTEQLWLQTKSKTAGE